MIPSLPLPLLAAPFLSQPGCLAAGSTPISWGGLMQRWQDGSITETVLTLNGNGSVPASPDNGAAVTISKRAILTLDGQGHTLSSGGAVLPELYPPGV